MSATGVEVKKEVRVGEVVVEPKQSDHYPFHVAEKCTWCDGNNPKCVGCKGSGKRSSQGSQRSSLGIL